MSTLILLSLLLELGPCVDIVVFLLYILFLDPPIWRDGKLIILKLLNCIDLELHVLPVYFILLILKKDYFKLIH